MKVFIDNQEIEIFSGARVGDVLMKYSDDDYHQVLAWEKVIVDEQGNRYSLDGEISEGDRFSVEARKNQGFFDEK
jgi:hypothetical protein